MPRPEKPGDPPAPRGIGLQAVHRPGLEQPAEGEGIPALLAGGDLHTGAYSPKQAVQMAEDFAEQRVT